MNRKLHFTDDQIANVYEKCNSVPMQQLAELCLNPNVNVTIEGLRDAGYAKVEQLEFYLANTLCYRAWEEIEKMDKGPDKFARMEEFKDILQNMSVPKAREYTRMIDDFLRVHYYKGNTMEKLGGCVRHNINS